VTDAGQGSAAVRSESDIFTVKKMKLKELSMDERPREKMLEKGPSSLSNAELLAILLRTGTGAVNVIDLARELLRSGGNKLSGIMSMPTERLCRIKGIGSSKAVTVAAAFELGRRCALEPVMDRKESICNPRRVFEIMSPRLRGTDHEECWGLFLNRANYIICKEQFSSGGMDSTVIDCKTIVRKALEKKATSLIIVHNHPSGNPIPGTNDIRETRNLKKALETCGITLTDHVIIADDSFYSFADEQKVEIF
jgi:DNA repair protein RadC